MKISARTCCKLTGIGLGMTLGGPLAGVIGNQLGDLTHDLIGDLLGGEQELGTSIGDFLANIGAGAFSFTGSAPADYPDFNHDFRHVLILALIESLEGPTPKRYTANVAGDMAKNDLVSRCLEKAAAHLRHQSKLALKKGDHAALQSLFPETKPDRAYLDLQQDSGTEAAKKLLEEWYDRALAAKIASDCADELRHLGGAVEFRHQTLAALVVDFPTAFDRVLKRQENERLRLIVGRLMMNDVRQVVQKLPVQIDGLDAKLEIFIQAHSDDRKLLAAMNRKLDVIHDTTAQTLAVSKASQKTGEANHDLLQKLTKQLLPDPIEEYKTNLLARFSIHKALGFSVEEDPKQKQGPDQIVDLFVQPTCSEQRISPEQMQADLKDGGSKAQALLPKLEKFRTVVLLADPGMGKSTLIQWLVTRLATSKDAESEKPVPLPIILREVVRDMPSDLEKWTWPTLLQTFLHHKHDDNQPPMAGPLAQNESVWRNLIETQQVWFLLDGLDEIGDPAKRRALRDAIWEGFNTHREARFLITSRVVGYEEAEIHRVWSGTGKPTPDLTPASRAMADRILRENFTDPPTDIIGRYFLPKGEHQVTLAALLYLAPWDDTQQATFSQYWFRQRLGDSAGQTRAREFVSAVHRNLSTATIGRVPNLLLLMALLFRHRVELPNGRAEVYAAISKAYLQSIAVDHRIEHRTLPYKYEEKERLLAIVAMHMQMRRVQRTQPEDDSTSGHIIASRADLEEWLCPEFGQGGDLNRIAEMEKFITHIADSSGLLLKRGMHEGQAQYAFAHLSFQEYYTACWLEREFRRLLNGKASDDEDELDALDTVSTPAPRAPLALLLEDFAAHAAHHLWREPLLFLAERLAASADDTQTLRKWLFPIRKEGPPLNFPAQNLLAAMSMDPQVNFAPSQRRKLWDHLWSLYLSKKDWWQKFGVATALLESSEYQKDVFASLRQAVVNTPEAELDLNGCTGVSDLSALKGLSSLQMLYLSGCTGISDLSPLQGLAALQSLDLMSCTGISDLSPLQELTALSSLDIRGCTRITDLSPLQGLVALQDLDLGGCMGISDLSPLQGLAALHRLDLSDCTGISDLSALQGLSGLKSLRLTGCLGVFDNQVKDLKRHLSGCEIIH